MASINNDEIVPAAETPTTSSWWPWSSSSDTVPKTVGWSNPLSWFSTKSTTTVIGGRYSRKSRRQRRSKKGGKKRKSLRFRQGG